MQWCLAGGDGGDGPGVLFLHTGKV
eukprot:COSAG02_NODE_60904_length_270_cov_0.596491_1_plen_24_part_10